MRVVWRLLSKDSKSKKEIPRQAGLHEFNLLQMIALSATSTTGGMLETLFIHSANHSPVLSRGAVNHKNEKTGTTYKRATVISPNCKQYTGYVTTSRHTNVSPVHELNHKNEGHLQKIYSAPCQF